MNAPVCVLRLYICGDTEASRRALRHFRRLNQSTLGGMCKTEVVDLSRDPQAARRDGIWAVPCLLRVLPEPPREIVGDLSDLASVLSGLELSQRA